MEITIELNEFPTHIPYTKNKVAPNKYCKINNQSLYNGKINRQSRAVFMENMHKYILNNLPNIKLTEFPIWVSLDFYTIINHGSIQRRMKDGIPQILYPEVKEGYVPTWDLDNLATIWRKAINDSLTHKGIIPDDNVAYIQKNSDTLHFIEDVRQRKIVITLKSKG
jgi:hypothetical protein